MKNLSFIAMMLMIFLAFSCRKDLPLESPEPLANEDNSLLKCDQLYVKIAVVSDIHYMDPSLLTNNAAQGEAFQNYLAQDPKLLEFSDPIFRNILSQVSRERPDILLIPGDLTKDGEKVSHETLAGLLRQLAFHHIRVYVVPGNHDINNPVAAAFDGNNAYPAPTVSPGEFASIYSNFGYNNAIYRDHNSLSYICQPARGLWILGIDACKYGNNLTTPEVSGAIKPETMTWIEERMAEANSKHINVIAMMHHGIIEHYTGQQQLDPGFVVDNWQETADALINMGLKVVFTGHYHANDITKRETNRKTLYDIETGSPVNTPSPFRIITLDNNSLVVDTKYVTDIDVPFPDGMDFVTYSNIFFQMHFDFYFQYFLMYQYSLPEDIAAMIAPLFRNAIMAHYAGDEKISSQERTKVKYVSDNISPELGAALMSLWTDLAPRDNKIRLNVNLWNPKPDGHEAQTGSMVYAE
jgi:3',5'-cyclic AMP phosphodiesterase CpdA